MVGHKRGYDEGYESGLVVGQKEGYDEGYESGLVVGHKRGYDEGYESGLVVGQKEGYDEGYESGLVVGQKEGLATRINLHNPTYKELMAFLVRDKTDSKPYIEGKYVSADFAAEVNNNAELEGIRAAFVGVYYPQPPGHGMVAFETVDEGLIFIEPQSDARVKLVVGKRFYLSIKPKPGYYYDKPSYDDTVVEIQIIW